MCITSFSGHAKLLNTDFTDLPVNHSSCNGCNCFSLVSHLMSDGSAEATHSSFWPKLLVRRNPHLYWYHAWQKQWFGSSLLSYPTVIPVVFTQTLTLQAYSLKEKFVYYVIYIILILFLYWLILLREIVSWAVFGLEVPNPCHKMYTHTNTDTSYYRTYRLSSSLTSS